MNPRKEQAIELRTGKDLSIKEIVKITGAAQSTVSLWLKSYPKQVAQRQPRRPLKERESNSKFFLMVSDLPKGILEGRKPAISEAAVLFRLSLHGFLVGKPMFDGSRIDWVVENPVSHKIYRVQVKSTRQPRTGLPCIRTRCYNGYAKTRAYKPYECDILVGYDMRTDVAYVFRYDNVRHMKTVTIRNDAAERWDLLE